MDPTLPTDVLTLQRELLAQRALTQQLMAEVAQLTLTVQKLQKLLFGSKAEKRAYRAASVRKSAITSSTSARQPNLRNGRRRLPDDLLRVRIDHDVPAEQQICLHCQATLQRFGEEVTEQLDLVPAHLIVKQHARAK